MPKFIVWTTERVEGTYEVEAPDADAARSRFMSGPPIKWEGVEQTDYQAFDVEVDHVEAVPGLSEEQA